MASRQLSAVVLAAGKGTRMRSDRAKVLHAANGKPLAYYPIRAALGVEPARVVVVVGHQGETVESELRAALPGAPLAFATQAQQLGTGHAVLCAKDALGAADSVLIVCGDTPLLTTASLQRLIEAREKAGAALSFMTFRAPDPKGYGRIVRDAQGAVQRIVEEKDATPDERKINEVNAGVYLCDAALLFKILAASRADNAQGEYYLTDVVAGAAAAARDGKQPAPVALETDAEETAGVNDRSQLSWVAQRLRARRLQQLMLEGVTILDPANTYVDEGVQVGKDAVLYPGVSLHGRTKVAAGVELGHGCVAIDAEIGEGTRVLAYSHLEQAKVGPRCTVGPFARLRPGAELLDEAHVGNFVELKKTRLGRGSKANHLAYLGDATIGDGCNIGAGTITCNYDGKNKHQTVIEDGAFIGSDTQLVAPLTVGKGAYVGTGATIREDVPAGSLAVSAGKQRVIEGWVAKKAPAKVSK